MLYLRITGASTFELLRLPGWERERLADALILLTTDPRPPFGTRLADLPGEAFEIWVGSEHRVHYRVFKDDDDDDIGVVVFGIF